ncbi:MAG: bifunctional glutamate N-acetyltransferase/amino-acid acetyltransferase ArgJ [Thiotrichales bacterium]
MAVGLNAPESLMAVAGVRLAVAAAGIRYRNRNDVVLIELARGSETAVVFTQNKFCAAPIQVAKTHLTQAPTRYLLINAGNANAGTGSAGIEDAKSSCGLVAGLADVVPESVLPFSTGVIGERLPLDRLSGALPDLLRQLTTDAWLDAARTIMTTDTLPKGASRRVELSGGVVTITGIAKGAGMICPNMATMLGFIATDALVDPQQLDALLVDLAEESFNCITIDGDTSTNDACVLIATGASEVRPMLVADAARFRAALREIFLELSHAIVRDAEGANKFITLRVEQARTYQEAKAVAYTVAHSPLVKTALYASDPNWGRILAAVGRAPVVDLAMQRIDIWLGAEPLIVAGEPAMSYTEAKGQAVVQQPEIQIRIALGRGDAAATVWTSDLSHEYVSVNASYRS